MRRVGNSTETRARILDAAEKLFASRGIDGASAAAITEAAGAKNRSAIGYHFGSKLQLLEEVLRRHIVEIERARDRILDELETAGEPTLPQLIDAMIDPVAAKLGSPSGVRYLQIQAAVLGYPDRNRLSVTVRDPNLQLDRLERMIHVLSPPGKHRDLTRELITILMYHGLADMARTPRTTKEQRRAFTAGLSTSILAILQAFKTA